MKVKGGDDYGGGVGGPGDDSCCDSCVGLIKF